MGPTGPKKGIFHPEVDGEGLSLVDTQSKHLFRLPAGHSGPSRRPVLCSQPARPIAPDLFTLRPHSRFYVKCHMKTQHPSSAPISAPGPRSAWDGGGDGLQAPAYRMINDRRTRRTGGRRRCTGGIPFGSSRGQRLQGNRNPPVVSRPDQTDPRKNDEFERRDRDQQLDRRDQARQRWCRGSVAANGGQRPDRRRERERGRQLANRAGSG